MSHFLNNLWQTINSKADQVIDIDIQGSVALCEIRNEKTVEAQILSQDLTEDAGHYPDINRLLKTIAEEHCWPNSFISIRLPDRYAKLILLNVDTHIKRQARLDEFVNWLLSNEYHLDTEQYSIKFQRCNPGSPILLVSLIEAKLIEAILHASIENKLPINSIESFSVAELNHSVISDGLMLSLDDDMCQLILLENICPVIIRSLPMKQTVIEDEIERLVKINPIARNICIRQHGDQLDSFSESLDQGLQEKNYNIINNGGGKA